MVFIRITTGALLCLLAGAIAVPGCSVTKAEVREAKNSGYDADFALVYSETLAAVRKLYPALSENASAGVIKTSWHQVRINPGTQDPPKNNQRNQTGLLAAQSSVRTLYFVRFTVRVLGGNPWRVSVSGQASAYDRTAAMPSELKGGDEPPWLEGRTNSLQVAIHKRLDKHAVKLPETARSKIAQSEPPPPLEPDPSQFAELPPLAAQAVAEALAASKSRDFAALGTTMHEKFTWSFGAEPSSRDALMMWQADSSVLARLAKSIEAGCRIDEAGELVTCPPAYTEEPGYIGYRAGFAPGKDGLWKMTFFVTGD